MYYLQSRYYDPEIGRFVNADGYVSTGQGFTGNNMFVYCGNNPGIYIDTQGTRYCASTSVSDESSYERYLACRFQNNVSLERAGVVVDLTRKLNEFMQINAEELEKYKQENGYFNACLHFYNIVNDGTIFDIKLQQEWAFESGKIYMYDGIVLRYDDPGNLNFGYMGKVLFSKKILCAGAGYNQMTKYGFAFGDVFSFFDDPRDNWMIKYGYSKNRR